MTKNAKKAKIHAKKIVGLLVGADVQGLPVLYVVDSILKNVGDPYVDLIGEKIVMLFRDKFVGSVDPQIRKKMFILRHTWTGVLQPVTLHSLDVAINEIDTAWPITALDKAREKVNYTAFQ